jgi:hypothetical protein
VSFQFGLEVRAALNLANRDQDGEGRLVVQGLLERVGQPHLGQDDRRADRYALVDDRVCRQVDDVESAPFARGVQAVERGLARVVAEGDEIGEFRVSFRTCNFLVPVVAPESD